MAAGKETWLASRLAAAGRLAYLPFSDSGNLGPEFGFHGFSHVMHLTIPVAGTATARSGTGPALEMQHHPGPTRRAPMSPRAPPVRALRIGQLLLKVLGQVSYLPGEICHPLLGADRGLSSLSQGGTRAVKLGTELCRDASLNHLNELFPGIRQVISGYGADQLIELAVINIGITFSRTRPSYSCARPFF